MGDTASTIVTRPILPRTAGRADEHLVSHAKRRRTSGCTGAGPAMCSSIVQRRRAGPVNLAFGGPGTQARFLSREARWTLLTRNSQFSLSRSR